MAKKTAQKKSSGGDGGKKQNQGAKGEGFTMTNPNTGQTMFITADDWKNNEAQYLASGFVKPEGVK